MTAYVILYGIIVLGAVLMSIKKENRKIVAIIFGISLVLLFGFRHPSMGIDLGYFGQKQGYLYAFKDIASMKFSEVLRIEHYKNFERGYIILNKIISLVSRNEQWFLFVIAILTILPIIYVLYKESDSIVLSTIIYVGLPSFLMLYSGLRQAIALSFMMVGLMFIKQKKPIKFIIIILFASLFHDSVLVFLLAYPLYYLKIRKSHRITILLFIPIVYLFREPLFLFLSKIFVDDAQMSDTGAFTLFLVFILINIFCIVFMDEEDKTSNGLLNIFTIACFTQAFGGIYVLALRVGYYFILPLILLLPRVLQSIKNESLRQTLSIIIALCFVAYGLYQITTDSWAMSYPYYWFWENLL